MNAFRGIKNDMGLLALSNENGSPVSTVVDSNTALVSWDVRNDDEWTLSDGAHVTKQGIPAAHDNVLVCMLIGSEPPSNLVIRGQNPSHRPDVRIFDVRAGSLVHLGKCDD